MAAVTVTGTALLAPAAANHSLVQDDPWEGDDELSREGRSHAIDIDGDTAISGAPREGAAGDAVVFVLSDADRWSRQARLTASGTDLFGYAVAVDGDTALVGAPHSGAQSSGAAFVFTRDDTGAWTQKARLEGAGLRYEEFGQSLDLHGDTAIVGAPADGASSAGSAFVFTRDALGNWTRQARLIPPSTNDAGRGVGLQGNRAVVGAPNYDGAQDDGEPPTGAAFVYERDRTGTWSQQAVLTGERPDDLTEGTRGEPDDATSFGFSIDLDRATVAVGDPQGYATTREFVTSFRVPVFDDRQAGVLYTFERDDGTWSQQARLFESRGPFPLGRAIDLDRGTLIPGWVPDPPVFAREDGEWTREDRLTTHEEDRPPNEATVADPVGPSGVAVEDGRALAGGQSSNILEFERRRADGSNPSSSFPVDASSEDDCNPHPPILITQDHGPLGFEATNPVTGESRPRPGSGVVAGNGTADDPYVIAGWCITPRKAVPGIWIRGTTAHVLIEGNELQGDRQANTRLLSAGIRLEDADNVTIVENTLRENRWGARVDDGSKRVTLVGNTASDNLQKGLLVRNSRNVRIAGNTVTNNTNRAGTQGIGLDLRNTSETQVTNNTISHNEAYGILVSRSPGATITRNTLIDPGERFGLFVVESDAAVLANNTLRNQDPPESTGFSLERTEGARVTANVIEDDQTALQLGSATATIARNSFTGNDEGLVLTNSSADARHNWWGAASGPSGGVTDDCTGTVATAAGDPIDVDEDSSVCFDPWLEEPDPQAGAG